MNIDIDTSSWGAVGGDAEVEKTTKAMAKFRFRDGTEEPEEQENQEVNTVQPNTKISKSRNQPPKYSKAKTSTTKKSALPSYNASKAKKSAPPAYGNQQNRTGSSSAKLSGVSGSEVQAKPKRGPMRMNSVTGKMTAIENTGTRKGYVREGCMEIPEHLLYAAQDAGLGSGTGMYSHIGALRKELNGSHNTGMRPGAGGGGRRPKQKKPARSVVHTKSAGGNIIAGFGPSSSSSGGSTKKRSNIKQVVQGRSRSVNSKPKRSISSTGSSSYVRQKGVVSTMNGCFSRKTQEYQDRKASGQLGAGPSSGSNVLKRSGRKSITRKLGGGSTSDKKAGGSKKATDVQSMREKRLAMLSKRLGKDL
eukprot:g1376.t1